MAAGLIIFPNYMPALDRNGRPYNGALAYFYDNHSTVPKTVYQDDGLTTPHTQPIETDSAGVFPAIYADASEYYTVAIATPTGAPLQSYDSVQASVGIGISQAGVLNPLIFGLICNSSVLGVAKLNAIAWNAMVAAYNAGTFTQILLPSGYWEIDDSITPLIKFTRAVSILGLGREASEMRMVGGSGIALDFDLSGAQPAVLTLKDFMVSTTQNEAWQAIRAVWATVASASPNSRFSAENMDITGVSTASGFSGGIELKNAYSPTGKNVNIYGRQTDGTVAGHSHMSWMWSFEADTSNYGIDLRLDNCSGYAAAISIKGRDHLEGLSINQCVFVFCAALSNIATSDTTLPPYFSFVGCQFEWYTVGDSINNASAIVYNSNVCFRTQDASAGSGSFLTIGECQDVQALGNKMTAGDTGTQDSNGIVLIDINQAQLADNNISGLVGAAIFFAGSSKNCTSSNDLVYPGANGVDFVNSSTNAAANNRRGMKDIDGGPYPSRVSGAISAPVTLTGSFQTAVSLDMRVVIGDRIRIQAYAHMGSSDQSGEQQIQMQVAETTTGAIFKFADHAEQINENGRLNSTVNNSEFMAREWTVDIIANADAANFVLNMATGTGGCQLTEGQLVLERL